MKDQELEVKLWLNDLKQLIDKLGALGAECVQPRVFELNLRYDTPERALSRNGQALRLRQDTEARLTYKGLGVSQAGVHARKEIEFTVNDYQAADEFLHSLGYETFFVYEKYRATYRLGDALIMVDELPFGNFIEIEASNPEEIKDVSNRLNLNWEARILESYTVLFERLKQQLALPFRDLTFENFSSYRVSAAVMGVSPAD